MVWPLVLMPMLLLKSLIRFSISNPNSVGHQKKKKELKRGVKFSYYNLVGKFFILFLSWNRNELDILLLIIRVCSV